MIKYTIRTVVIILFGIFILSHFSSPVSATEAKSSQRWVCLKVDWCLDQAAFNEDPKRYVANPLCSPQAAPNGHRVRLTAKSDAKPIPNKDTYIVECLATDGGETCTTGLKASDMVIYGKDNTAVLKKSDNYEFQGIFEKDGKTASPNPRKSLVSGEIGPIEWQSYSKGNARKFFGMNFYDPNDNQNWLGRGAQQQGTFTFETQSNLKDCVSISWDPYGRVFDSRSLEPIPSASVELLKKRSDGQFTRLLPSEIMGGAIDNPFMTESNGGYSFVVPDGTYKLSVTHRDYVFPGNIINLNANYNNTYSDIYPHNTGEIINQKGKIEHRDIPLDSKNGQGIIYPVKLTEYFYNLDKERNTVIIEGIASHPLTKIRMYSLKNAASGMQTRYRLIKTVQTDKNGKFKIEIDQSQFEPTEVFGDVELEKADFSGSHLQTGVLHNAISFLQHKFMDVNAAQSNTGNVRLMPILNKLQGYAYNTTKQTIPNSSVGVYLAFSSKPYYESKADEKGFYSIASENLPDSPYTIKYVLPQGSTSSLTTAAFVSQNSSYLTKNNINLNVDSVKPKFTVFPTKTEEQKKIPTMAQNRFSAQALPSQYPSTPSILPVQKKPISANASFIISFIILLVLILGTGVLLATYVMKKNQER